MKMTYWMHNKYNIYLPHSRAIDSTVTDQTRPNFKGVVGNNTIVAKHSYLKHVIWDPSLAKKTETRLSQFLNRFISTRYVKA